MSAESAHQFVSRAGEKLEAALRAFAVDPRGLICADLGCNVGGFTDCLLQHGAAKVYAVDTAYGQLAWKLRRDPRVVVRERTNALHLTLPEPVQLVAVDVGWTRQHLILPVARGLLVPCGHVITLLKPHYEAEPPQLRGGVLPDELGPTVLAAVQARLAAVGLALAGIIPSPLRGSGGNQEYLAIM